MIIAIVRELKRQLMKNSKHLLLVYAFSFGVFTSVFGQLTIKGKVVDQSNNAAISYANIGILNSNFGTISNSDGSFSIKIPTSHLKENLLFSAIGYEKKSLAVNSFTNEKEVVIYLIEKVTILDEVVISASTKEKKEKLSWLGNPRKYRGVQGMQEVDSTSAGGAMALLIEKKDNFNLQFIKEAKLFISRNTEPEFKVRVRFLEVDKSNNNLPGDDLFNESIVLTSYIKRGWLTFDLSSFNLKINEDSFFLVFEWILEDEDRLKLFDIFNKYLKSNPDKIKKDTILFEGKKVPREVLTSFENLPMIIFGDVRTKSALKKHKSYLRKNSFAQWKRSLSIMSANVLMSNKPSKKSSSSNGDVITSENQEETLKSKIEKWGKAFREKYNIPGMQLSVSLKNSTLFSGGFGYSDIENEKKVSPQTRFRIASVTKPMTATAIMKLASEKKMDLDADVRKYVPAFPEKKYTLTTRQLAGHLGGIRDYYEISIDEVIGNPHFENATEAINVFKNDTLMSKPGNQYLYSSFGYNLIGAAIEGASGQTYLEYMQEHIWNPLLMFNTYGDIADSTMIRKSKFYYPNEEEAKPYDLSYGHASGGIISTTSDLLRFGNEMLYGDLFKYSFKRKLFKTQYTTDKRSTNYGLGWYIGKDMNRNKIWYHVGQGPSSGAVLIIYPDDDIVISLLTNTPILVNSEDGLPMEVLKLAALIYQK